MTAPGPTILVADDDAAVRTVVAAALRSAGYVVLEAATCDEALRHADAAPNLLIADLVMPPDGGLDLADRLRARIPGLAVLHISGYAARTEFNGDPSAVLLSKPFSNAELHAHVEWLLAARPTP
jgi:two-component system cell cycle response regulator CpdR